MEEQVKSKLLDALDIWCQDFMILGTPSETPRYSQVIDKTLKSTIMDIYYTIDFSLEEMLWIDEMQEDERLWSWWKQVRTDHLVNNYKTINPY